MQIPTMPQTIDWEQLFAWFPMLMDLDGCPQDVIFHAEGDVLVHTKMVLEALMTHSNWQQLDADWQQILWWSALLHDIAKPLTTIEEYNRIRSPRHALKGAQIVQNLLYQDFPSELVPLRA
ncbi:MAG: HDIG domain-containing metalloprotein [Chloroflexota bacterium]